MLRKMLLATSTLSVILVLFFVYHLSTGGAVESDAEPVEVILAEKELVLPEVAESQPVQQLAQIKGVPIGAGGKKAWVTWYDKKTRKARIQFRATTWEPTSDTEFHLVDLEVRMLMPGGQIAEVQADEGHILVSPGDLSESSIRRGRLWGNVQIRIDRTSPEWREQNPDRRDMALHPEKVVRLWMDEFKFDLELSRMETSSAFHIQSAEIDLEGSGLLLRWNEEEDRVDFLEIAQGKHLELRGLRSKMDFTLLNSRAQVIEVEEEAPAAGEAEPASPEEQEEDQEALAKAEPGEPLDDELLQIDFGEDEEPKQPVTYEARFSENVMVEQHRGLESTGKLEADILTLLFDTGQFKEVADGPSEEQAAQAEQAADEGRRTRLTLTWQGPLIVEPKGRLKPDQETRRFQIEARGDPVRLEDNQGWATCDRLIYHNETGRLWLHGRPLAPVRISAGPQRSMHTETLFYDRRENVAKLSGAGEMEASTRDVVVAQQADIQDPTDKRTTIRWTRSVELTMTQSEFTVRDEKTGEPKRARSPWVQRAVLDGEVLLAQAEQQARAEHMEIDFAPPDRPGRLISDLRRFEARGAVQLASDANDIRGDDMVIDMSTAPDGENVPVRAVVRGHAVARQGRRVIQARDYLAATMSEVPRPVPELSDAEVRQLARTRGIDPEAMAPDEWERRRDEWLARRARRTETAIVHLEARGEVHVDDPERELRVRSDQLECTFPDGRQIEKATVVALSGRTSTVQFEDFAIAGHRIQLDASEPWALVPGPGETEFYSDQDLDGRKLKEPIPVAVSWNGRMEMRGSENQLYFEEGVRATSTDRGQEHYTLDCDKLILRFVDLPAPITMRTQGAEPDSYWIFQLLVKRWRRDESGRSTLFGEQSPDRTFRKKPVVMMADGNAVALYSGYDPNSNALLSRMRIAGPRIAVDLRRQSTNVEGAGNLLIENYRLPTPQDKRRRAAGRVSDSLLADWAAGGPSQTLFTWENSMSFLTRRNVAIFDGKVNMNHRAGAEMEMIRDIVAGRDVDVTQLQKLKGRRTALGCNNLLVEFERTDSDGSAEAMSGARSADLRLIEAMGPVTLRDASKTLVGHQLVYLRDSGLITIRAQPGREAHIYDEDGESGALRAHWRGPVLRWNLNTNRIEASKSTILLGGR
ncbi:MAG: hypothetical protein JSU68_11515 [Phycisphaerales bacterium]|nr:MAG: hypothetical protein JSU68_11515 [Phycisphaerales bacterium]